MNFPKLSELKSLRQKVEISQEGLAEQVGISQSSIAKYENNLQTPSYGIACKIFDILLQKEQDNAPTLGYIAQSPIYSIHPDDKLQEALDLMKDKSISQVPVLDNAIVVGTVNESKLIDLLQQYHNLTQFRTEKVEKVMDAPMPVIPKDAKTTEITELLKNYNGVLVSDKGQIIGIVTSADLLSL